MNVRVGTFNLNNLFSRFNFAGVVGDGPSDTPGGITLSFAPGGFSVRTFMGRLVREKLAEDTDEIAGRISDAMDADVLAVQEVEHIEVLKEFNRDKLGGLYPHVILVEGNDRRLIDVGFLSKLPVGRIVSHQCAVHREDPGRRVFSRDLLQVEVLNASRSKKLFTFYNTHLKSHYVPFGEDAESGAKAANERRKRQAEVIAEVVGREERPNSRFVIAGDMNDPPDSEFLQPMLMVDGQPLVNALADPAETRPAKAETHGQGPGPQSKSWTHRYNPPGPEFPRYELYDHIWVSQALAGRFSGAAIDRRKSHGGDGSDHDPAWVDLDLD